MYSDLTSATQRSGAQSQTIHEDGGNYRKYASADGSSHVEVVSRDREKKE